MILTKDRSIKQNREPRNSPKSMLVVYRSQWSLTENQRQCNGQKMVFVTKGAGIARHSHVKNKFMPFIKYRPYTLHKNSHKMDHRPKCRIQNYEILRRTY